MTQTSYPFDNQDTTEAQYSQLFRRLQSSGVSGTPGSTDLKVSADSSGMNVKVQAGFAIVRGHAYRSDAEETLTIPAASTNPRRDLVVLRLDPSTNSIVLAVKSGTAATSPSDPSLTQTETDVYELALARVEVAANSVTISASNVTDRRSFLGTQVGIWPSALRPAGAIGLVGYNTSTNRLEIYNGSAWVSVAQTGDAVTASQISSTEQASIVAGKIRSGGSSSGADVSIFVQSTTPTANAVGDLWFWGA